MTPGKRDPARLSQYWHAHQNHIEHFERSGFVEPGHGAEFFSAPEGFMLEADFRCAGGLFKVSAKKLARVVEDGDDPVVQTYWYSYVVQIPGVGQVFRYDSPFRHEQAPEGHHTRHHVHRYDVLHDGAERIETLDPEEVPHLGEVLEEAQRWQSEHFDELRARGLV